MSYERRNPVIPLDPSANVRAADHYLPAQPPSATCLERATPPARSSASKESLEEDAVS